LDGGTRERRVGKDGGVKKNRKMGRPNLKKGEHDKKKSWETNRLA